MVRKSLIASLLSFAVYFIPAFFIWYYKEQYKLGGSFFRESVIQFFFYSLPVILIIFLALLIFNFWFAGKVKKQTIPENNKFYFLFLGTASIILTLGFTVFDYFQFNKFGSSGSFLHILAGYSELIIFILVVVLLNRKICFNNFK
jgi:hypothetical protein